MELRGIYLHFVYLRSCPIGTNWVGLLGVKILLICARAIRLLILLVNSVAPTETATCSIRQFTFESSVSLLNSLIFGNSDHYFNLIIRLVYDDIFTLNSLNVSFLLPGARRSQRS